MYCGDNTAIGIEVQIKNAVLLRIVTFSEFFICNPVAGLQTTQFALFFVEKLRVSRGQLIGKAATFEGVAFGKYFQPNIFERLFFIKSSTRKQLNR